MCQNTCPPMLTCKKNNAWSYVNNDDNVIENRNLLLLVRRGKAR